MGNAHVHRGRLAPAVIMGMLLTVALIVALGALARPAAAQDTVHVMRQLPQLRQAQQ